ncbi:MAG: VCBS repeat-containing protein [Planctomycetes bacterium]|nr:VCBS repeat-containing protein [Planctomycetota bacterium]
MVLAPFQRPLALLGKDGRIQKLPNAVRTPICTRPRALPFNPPLPTSLMRTLALALSSFALAAPSFAQIPLALFGAPARGAAPKEDAAIQPHSRAWPAALSRVGSLRRSQTAGLTAHGIPDVIVLDGDRVVAFAAPGIHSHIDAIPGTETLSVNDFTVLSGRGNDNDDNPAHDALALACVQGLEILRFDPGTGVSDLRNVGGQSLANAQLVASHRMDPNTMFAVDAANNLQCLVDSGGGYLALGSGTRLSSASLDMECIDWEGDGDVDVAVLMTTGLEVFDSQGVQLASFPGSHASGDLCRFHQAGGDSIAWLHPQGAASEITVATGWAAPASVAVALPQNYVGVSGGDWTDDGLDELTLSTTDNLDTTVLLSLNNPAGPFYYHYLTAFDVAVAPSVHGGRSPNLCAPVVADFDGDGDSDLLMPIEDEVAQPDTSSYTLADSKIIHRAFEPRQPEYLYMTGEPEYLSAHPGETHGTIVIPVEPAAGFSHMHVVFWLLNLDGKIEAIAPTQALVSAQTLLSGPHVEMPILDDYFAQDGEVFIMIRPVNLHNGHIVAAGQADLVRSTPAPESGVNSGWEGEEEIPPAEGGLPGAPIL